MDHPPATGKRPVTHATLTKGPVRQHLVSLTVPMIWGLAAMMTFNIADTWFVAQISDRDLAAMSFTFPVVMTLISMGIGLMAGTASVVARALGKGDLDRVRRLTTDAAVVAIVISLVMTVVGLYSLDFVFTRLGADAETLPLVRDYMVPWYLGLVFVLLPMVGMGAIRATGDSKLQSRILIYAAVLNLILDPILIFGLAGLPEMGIQGAAVATVIARAVSFVIGFYALHFKKKMIVYNRPPWREFWSSCKDVLHIGVPAAGTNMVIPLSTGIVIALIAGFGSEAVAGFGAASRIEQMTLIAFYAMSAIIGPFVGQNLGAGHHHRIQRAISLCARFCLLSAVGIAVLLAVCAPFLMRQFSANDDVVFYGSLYLWIVPMSFGFQGIVMVVNAAFNGVGRPLPGVVVSVSRMLLIYVPTAFILSIPFGVSGIYVGAALANLLSGVLAWYWFRSLYGAAAEAGKESPDSP